jgi:hypothetical protein
MSTMTPSDYIRVNLRMEHPSVSAQEIAEAVGLPLAHMGVKGEVRGPPRRDRSSSPTRATWPLHYASFSFGEGEGRTQLEAALGVLETKATEIGRLVRSGGALTLCFFIAPVWGWGIELTAKELELLARFGTVLGFEVHRNTDVTDPTIDVDI